MQKHKSIRLKLCQLEKNKCLSSQMCTYYKPALSLSIFERKAHKGNPKINRAIRPVDLQTFPSNPLKLAQKYTVDKYLKSILSQQK